MNENNDVKYYYAKHVFCGETYIVASDKILKLNSDIKADTQFGEDILKVVFPCCGSINKDKVIACSELTVEDIANNELNNKRIQELYPDIIKCIEDENLSMKVLDVHPVLGGDKIVLLYSSDGRVDFRNLVVKLNEIIRPSRIQMYQIAIRETARCFPTVGICGRKLCCEGKGKCRHFPTVTRKMAKEQNIKQEDFKLLGACENLKCCLSYEVELYKSEMSFYPQIKTEVHSDEGIEHVRDINILKQTVTLENAEHGRRVVKAINLSKNTDENGKETWVLKNDDENNDDQED